MPDLLLHNRAQCVPSGYCKYCVSVAFPIYMPLLSEIYSTLLLAFLILNLLRTHFLNVYYNIFQVCLHMRTICRYLGHLEFCQCIKKMANTEHCLVLGSGKQLQYFLESTVFFFLITNFRNYPKSHFWKCLCNLNMEEIQAGGET